MEELKNGSIRISDEVIADIAAKAAQDVDGVASVAQRILPGTKGLISSRGNNVNGISLLPTDSGLDVTVQISVVFGSKIQDVCASVQQEVADAVADMTGILVRRVNVSVVSVSLPKPVRKGSK